MQGQVFAIIALILMMVEPLQAIQLTTTTVVGNLLFEQSAMYVVALLVLVMSLMIWFAFTYLPLSIHNKLPS